ncbi:MAG: DUF4258 domain-containing protein [bacterium]
MIDYQFSEHAYDMLRERNIKETWVRAVMENPELQEIREDGTVHYLRAIDEYDGRYLRVVINPDFTPNKIVTVFFDRRLQRKV